MNEFPAWLASTLASDATEGRGVLPPWIGSLKPEARAVGPAFVALMSQDDNLSVREAIKASPPPGSVLVVAGGSTSRTATIGGLMALEMQNAGHRRPRYRWPGARCKGDSADAAVLCVVSRAYPSSI